MRIQAHTFGVTVSNGSAHDVLIQAPLYCPNSSALCGWHAEPHGYLSPGARVIVPVDTGGMTAYRVTTGTGEILECCRSGTPLIPR